MCGKWLSCTWANTSLRSSFCTSKGWTEKNRSESVFSKRKWMHSARTLQIIAEEGDRLQVIAYQNRYLRKVRGWYFPCPQTKLENGKNGLRWMTISRMLCLTTQQKESAINTLLHFLNTHHICHVQWLGPKLLLLPTPSIHLSLQHSQREKVWWANKEKYPSNSEGLQVCWLLMHNKERHSYSQCIIRAASGKWCKLRNAQRGHAVHRSILGKYSI